MTLTRINKCNDSSIVYSDADHAATQYRVDFGYSSRQTAKSHLFDLLMGKVKYRQNVGIAWTRTNSGDSTANDKDVSGE